MVRVKRRYALCEVVKPETKYSHIDVTSDEVYRAIKSSILDTHGEFGLAFLQKSLKVTYMNIDTNIVIVRAPRDFFNLLASSLVFVNKIGSHKCFLKTIHVGGSIQACQKFVIRYHRDNMVRLFPNCTSQTQRAQVMESIMEACNDLEAPGLRHKSDDNKGNYSTALDKLNSADVS